MIAADAGGSNSYRSWAIKVELVKLAATIGLVITVLDIPPGTSKWNKIGHRRSSLISIDRRGKPLTSYRTVVELIAGTTTRTGLTVQVDLDAGHYAIGVKVTDKQLEEVPMKRHDWHYTILPP